MSAMNVFDAKVKRLQQQRAGQQLDVKDFDYLKEEIGYRMSDRLLDIQRKFRVAVDLGCGRGYVSRHLTSHSISEKLHLLDPIDVNLDNCQLPPDGENIECIKHLVDLYDDHVKLPFSDSSVDIVVSSLSLHWVNNLPHLFSEVCRILKNDGVFLGCMFGGDTLYELRSSLQLADVERSGGVGVHISPYVSVPDLSALLKNAKFNMLTLDSDELPVSFASIFTLMRDLKGMGENAATHNRSNVLTRDVLMSTSAIYQHLYGSIDDEGRIKLPATFQVHYWIGWKPDPSQPKPLSPNTQSDVSFKDLESLDSILEEKLKTKK